MGNSNGRYFPSRRSLSIGNPARSCLSSHFMTEAAAQAVKRVIDTAQHRFHNDPASLDPTVEQNSPIVAQATPDDTVSEVVSHSSIEVREN
jgi:hypothetical protein